MRTLLTLSLLASLLGFTSKSATESKAIENKYCFYIGFTTVSKKWGDFYISNVRFCKLNESRAFKEQIKSEYSDRSDGFCQNSEHIAKIVILTKTRK